MKAALPLIALALWSGTTASTGEQPLKGFLARADAIFVGRVIDQRSSWDDSHQLIWTDHVFEVENWLKGGADAILMIREAGGTVGDLTLTLSHPVEYRLNSSYLVFAAQGAHLRTLEGEWGRLPLFESGGSSFVRISAEHPLSSLSDRDAHSLQDIRVLAGRLRQRLGQE